MTMGRTQGLFASWYVLKESEVCLRRAVQLEEDD